MGFPEFLYAWLFLEDVLRAAANSDAVVERQAVGTSMLFMLRTFA